MIESLEQLINDHSFRRFISGGADDSERLFWTQWIDSDPRHRKMYEDACVLLKKFRIESRVQTDDQKDWSDLEQLLSREEESPVYKLPVFSGKESTFKFLLRYAAIFLVISMVGLGLWLVSNNRNRNQNAAGALAEVTVQTGYSQIKTIKLSDGSQIILAPNSKLTHTKDWLSKPTKDLKLSGEAYFNIVEKKKPTGKARFKIITPSGVVRDIGTKFNVSTFDDKTVVVLESGIVNVSKEDKESDLSTRVLKPGQMALLSKRESSIKVSDVNTRVYTSWKTKTLYFDNTPLTFFLSYLKNYYGTRVVVKDSTLLNRSLSDGIDRGSVKDMVKVISHVLNINMYQKGDTVYVGSNSKSTKKGLE